MSTRRATDATLDWWAQQGNATDWWARYAGMAHMMPALDRLLMAMAIELRERRAAERTHTPCDWDYESHCVYPGCRLPATHRILVGMVGNTPPYDDNAPLYDMVCCAHSATVQEGS